MISDIPANPGRYRPDLGIVERDDALYINAIVECQRDQERAERALDLTVGLAVNTGHQSVVSATRDPATGWTAGSDTVLSGSPSNENVKK